jgi:inorganic pyrophosphatase
MNKTLEFADLVTAEFPWLEWEGLISAKGVEIDRPIGSSHPRFADIVYPIDYGFVPGTIGSDGEPVDVFVGTAETGLVGAILTTDYRRGDREVKLLLDCSPEEVYLVNGFINFDQNLMEGRLVLRHDMAAIRKASVTDSREAGSATPPD